MKLNDVKAGDICAYVDDYSHHRRSHWCSSDVMDAKPVRVIRKEKIPVRIEKDSCGRATVAMKTVLAVKLYNLKASDPLALDLDIVDTKHQDLVVDETIEAKDLIWSWEEEVEKVREDLQVAAIANRFGDYLEAVGYAITLHVLKTQNYPKEADPYTYQLRLNYPRSSLKTFISDALKDADLPALYTTGLTPTDLTRYLPDVTVEMDLKYGNSPHYLTNNYRQTKIGYAENLYTFLFTSQGYTFLDSERPGDAYPKNKRKQEKHWNQQKRIFRAFAALTGEERLDFLESATNVLAERVAKSLDIVLPLSFARDPVNFNGKAYLAEMKKAVAKYVPPKE